MIQPIPLQAGDTIGIVCPSGHIPLEKVQVCIQTIETWGYKVKLGETVGTQKNCFSATDDTRAKDLQWMLDDTSIKAILCARGGYGASRIVQHINFNTFFKAAKDHGNLQKDPYTHQYAISGFTKSLSDKLTKSNLLWGHFIPFKSLSIDDKLVCFLC